MNAKHTPGPWGLRPQPIEQRLEIIGGCNYLIGAIFDNNGYPQNQDNARLIAAAPDLLEALVDIVENGLGTEAVKRARAAIAKARGEA